MCKLWKNAGVGKAKNGEVRSGVNSCPQLVWAGMNMTKEINRNSVVYTQAWILILMMSMIMLVFISGMFLASVYNKIYGTGRSEARLHKMGMECLDPVLGHKRCETDEDVLCSKNH